MDIEFLDLQICETDEVKKTNPMYDFPAVTFHKNASYTACFNRHTRKLLGDSTYIKILANAEYVVFQPSTKKEYHSHKINYNKSGGFCFNCAGLERYGLHGKAYKLYKTQKGLAIKINEPIRNRK